MVNCLFEGNGDINKADWQSAGILLGLAPTILSTLSPTMEERNILSYRRPILGLLLSIGAPSISYFSRVWVTKGTNRPVPSSSSSQPITPTTPALVWVGVRYTLVLMAAANVVENLGHQAILSWKCGWPWLQLMWVLLTPIPYLLGICGVRAFNKGGTDSGFRKLPKAIKGELKRCFNPEENESTHRFARFLRQAANLTGFFHYVFGTLVLSSGLFIGTIDALGVLARFAASAIVCYWVAAFELKNGGIRTPTR